MKNYFENERATYGPAVVSRLALSSPTRRTFFIYLIINDPSVLRACVSLEIERVLRAGCAKRLEQFQVSSFLTRHSRALFQCLKSFECSISDLVFIIKKKHAFALKNRLWFRTV